MKITSKYVSITGFLSLLFSAIAMVGLGINVNNWANIARASQYEFGRGSVGVDTAFWMPLGLGAVLVIVSVLLNKRKITKLQVAALCIMLTIIAVWAGMGFAVRNPYQIVR